jgi:hypothetical protein
MQRVFQVGERVRGIYHGVAYIGTVAFGRAHTLNSSYKHYIDLDTPIVLYGATRTEIIVSVFEPMESGNTIEPNEV